MSSTEYWLLWVVGGFFVLLDHIMPVLKKVFNACKDSFKPTGPVSEEALEKVRAIIGWRSFNLKNVLCFINYYCFPTFSLLDIYLCVCVCGACVLRRVAFWHSYLCLVVFYPNSRGGFCCRTLENILGFVTCTWLLMSDTCIA